MKVDLLDFLPVLEEKRGDFGYLLVNLVVLKIEVCFSFMKINHNLVEGGWGALKKFSSLPEN